MIIPLNLQEQITSMGMKAHRVCHVLVLTATQSKADAEMISPLFTLPLCHHQSAEKNSLSMTLELLYVAALLLLI